MLLNRPLRSPLPPPLSLTLTFLISRLCLIYPSFTSSSYIRSSLPRSFVDRFSLHCFFLLHVDKDFVSADHQLHSPLYAPFFFPFFISFSLLSSVFILLLPLWSRTDQPTVLCKASRRRRVSARIPVSGPPNALPLLLLQLPPLLPSYLSSRHECRSTLTFST